MTIASWASAKAARQLGLLWVMSHLSTVPLGARPIPK
jgi:hypothetical protein